MSVCTTRTNMRSDPVIVVSYKFCSKQSRTKMVSAGGGHSSDHELGRFREASKQESIPGMSFYLTPCGSCKLSGWCLCIMWLDFRLIVRLLASAVPTSYIFCHNSLKPSIYMHRLPGLPRALGVLPGVAVYSMEGPFTASLFVDKYLAPTQAS